MSRCSKVAWREIDKTGAYIEGVMLATKFQYLFRVVTPSLYLALGMTEKHEKAERRALMDKHQCSELDAAIMVARSLDSKRRLDVATHV